VLLIDLILFVVCPVIWAAISARPCAFASVGRQDGPFAPGEQYPQISSCMRFVQSSRIASRRIGMNSFSGLGPVWVMCVLRSAPACRHAELEWILFPVWVLSGLSRLRRRPGKRSRPAHPIYAIFLQLLYALCSQKSRFAPPAEAGLAVVPAAGTGATSG
jgi:hypothetical protein